MKEPIRLNHVVSTREYPLLRHGIGYYTWVKSRKADRYYLLPLKKYEKNCRLVGGIAGVIILCVLFCTWFYHLQGWLGVLVGGCIVNGLTCFFVFLYYKNAVKLIDRLPGFPIAVSDLEKGVLKIRNSSHLPFVQTTQDDFRIDIANLQYIKVNVANKVYNGRQQLWVLHKQIPSWTALSVRGKTVDGKCETQLLFVGERMPENMYDFFEITLRLKLERKADYSYFES